MHQDRGDPFPRQAPAAPAPPVDDLGPAQGRTTRQFALGVAAGIGMVAIWGSWAAITRKGALEIELPVLVLIRFLVPALFFLPVTLRVGLLPAHVGTRDLVLMIAGSGAFFFLCAAFALWFAPVAEAGPLMPGTPPLLVALYMVFWQGHRFRSVQIAGLVLITFGIVAIVGWRMWQSHELLAGHVLALLAAVLWSAYTVAFRRSGMSALECAAVVSAWSAFIALPFGLWFLIEEWQAGRHVEILAQVAMQGFGSGVVAVLLYGFSVRALGAPEAAAMVALSPLVSVALAVPLLGETPEWAAIAGIAAMTLGVVMTNWREPKARQETRPETRWAAEPQSEQGLDWDQDRTSRAADGAPAWLTEADLAPPPPPRDEPGALPDWLARPRR